MAPKGPKVWKEAMELIVETNPPTVTALTLSAKLYGKPKDQEEASRNRSAAGQLLRRLRQWGYIRPVEPIYADGGGRPQLVYEPTERAVKKFGRTE